MIYAGSLSFLNLTKGIPILYNFYIRHQEIQAPFKFVSDVIDTEFSVPVLRNMISFPEATRPSHGQRHPAFIPLKDSMLGSIG